ncbi:hypothetical protein [Tractidigestivibacter sp.]|uniref:hypothetical protein n=1 Tax=Tractidigestivibacter sp. TaxID=2847320 RepID=UPI003FD752F3
MDFSGLVDRLKEMVPKPRPEVNLSFDEYVDVLYGIVEQCAEDVRQSDEACALSGNDVATASAHKREIGVWQVVLLSAMKLWNSSGRFKDKTKVAIENEMISRVVSGQGLSGDEAEAFRSSYFDAATRLAKGDEQGKMSDEQRYAVQVIALMRAALSAGYDGAEDALNAATEKSSMRVLDMERMVVHLAQSSVVDGNTALMKRPRFFVAQ